MILFRNSLSALYPSIHFFVLLPQGEVLCLSLFIKTNASNRRSFVIPSNSDLHPPRDRVVQKRLLYLDNN